MRSLTPFGKSIPGQSNTLHTATGSATFDIVMTDQVVGRSPALERASHHLGNTSIGGLVRPGFGGLEMVHEGNIQKLIFDELIAQEAIDFPKRIHGLGSVKRQSQPNA